MVALIVLVVAWALASADSERDPCRTKLPQGARVPAPVVLKTSCGHFLLARDGKISRLPRSWFAERSGGTGRRYGGDLQLRRTRPGRIVLLRRGRLVWRSSGLYRNDAGYVAFGPGAFAFAAYRRGIFLTDLEGRERLVLRGVGLFPIEFLPDGRLLVSQRSSVTVLSRAGQVLRRYRYRTKNGFVFDAQTGSLFFVTPGRVLARAEGGEPRHVRPLRRLDGSLAAEGRYLTLSEFAHRGRSDETGLTVLRRDGRLVARWRWASPKGSNVDYRSAPSRDGRAFAFRTVTRPRGTVVVYVLRAGDKHAMQVLRHRGRQLGCGVGASLDWHGRFLLYSATDGPAAIVDTRDGRTIGLARVARNLPRLRGGRAAAYWLSAFRKS